MSFLPAIPFGGLAGWALLERTRVRQEDAFQQSPAVMRRTTDFTERIGRITSAEQLVRDRALLEVALGAFGLDDDLRNRFFIRKVLEEGTTAPSALANRLTDKRYLALAEAFGFGDRPGGNVTRPGFADAIVARYRERQFEVVVGRSNPDLRIAMGLDRELADIVARRQTNDARWFTAMSSPPVRKALERALGLPALSATIDIDRQLNLFKERAAARIGTDDFASVASAEGVEKLRRAFLAAPDSLAAAGSARGAGALALLSRSVVAFPR
jgi:hypothetical protein